MGAADKKQLKKILREAENQGWRVKETKKGYMLLAPDKVNKVTLHKTASDHRALDNALSLMRDYGFVWGDR
jgi:hypothetical protein